VSPPLRGERAARRREVDRLVGEALARRAAPDHGPDLGIAAVEAEVELAREREGTGYASDVGGPGRPPIRGRAAGGTVLRDPGRSPRGGRRIPDLSRLPRLLVDSGAFGALADRLGAPDEAAPRVGRHAAVTAVPHAAKTFLVAALARSGERVCWIARDAEIGDRVAEELGAWLGDPSAVAVLEPRTALAYERSELVPDETASRVAALAAWRTGRAPVLVASVQALLQATIRPDELPEPRMVRSGDRIDLDDFLRGLHGLGYSRVLEVAGRGEFARRGGIVDLFPPSAELPVRIELFGDEIDSIRAFDPTDQRSVGPSGPVELLPASEFLRPTGGPGAVVARLGRLSGNLPERLAADLARLEGDDPADSRALAVGDAAEIWAPVLTGTTGLDHVEPGTLVVIDEPGDLAGAAEFLWRQEAERRADLIAAGDLPDRWPAPYADARHWRSSLAAARTLELTWMSDLPGEATLARGALASGDLFGWREPTVLPGRTGRLAEMVEGWASDGGRVVLASDQAPRLAELLGEAGRPVAVVSRIDEPPEPGGVVLVERSLNGGFEGGPDGLVLVTDRELFGSVRVRRPKALRRVVPRDLLERLTPGDLVVHIDHGIARYERMIRRSSGLGDDRDFLELRFAGSDRIYVPVEQIERLSRYSGGEAPTLSRLGGTEWLRTKQRVKRAVTDLAQERSVFQNPVVVQCDRHELDIAVRRQVRERRRDRVQQADLRRPE